MEKIINTLDYDRNGYCVTNQSLIELLGGSKTPVFIINFHNAKGLTPPYYDVRILRSTSRWNAYLQKIGKKKNSGYYVANFNIWPTSTTYTGEDITKECDKRLANQVAPFCKKNGDRIVIYDNRSLNYEPIFVTNDFNRAQELCDRFNKQLAEKFYDAKLDLIKNSIKTKKGQINKLEGQLEQLKKLQKEFAESQKLPSFIPKVETKAVEIVSSN